jgi:E1A/CREB-binding protein
MIEEQRRKPKKRKLTKEEKEKRRKRMANVIHSLTKDQLKSLFGSLRTEFNPFWNAQRMKTTFKPLIKKITDLEWGWIFSDPVDPDKLQLKDYFKIIKRPMDLGTVRRNLDKGMYKVPKLMYHDIKLTFDNAMLFNPEGSDVHAIAKEYMQKFKEGFSEVMTQMIEQEKIARSRKDACTMCGGERFTFEPPVFYCNGRCHKRIGRNRFYYTTPENKFHYCQSCYQTCLKPQFELNGQTVNKRDLIKKKNNDTKQESWVRIITIISLTVQYIYTKLTLEHRYNAIRAKDGFT